MFFSRMSLKDAGAFCRRIGIGLRAGVDIVRLLTAESGYGSPRQREALASVLEGIKEGFQVSEMMQKRSDFFPKLMISLTRVGEQTGKLEQTFLTLAAHYENQAHLRRQFLRSIAWPCIQLGLGLMVISIVIWVLGILTPSTGGQMVDILGFGLRGESGVLVFWFYIALFALGLWLLYYGFSKNFGGVQSLLPVFYLVPKFGPSIQTITLSRFTRTLALSLGAGLDPIRSVKLSLDSTDSDYYRGGAELFETAVRDQGRTMTEGLRSTDLFPEMFLQMAEVAELSGTESESIDHLADQYEDLARGAMQTLSGIATTVVWLFTAGIMIFLIMRIFFTAVAPIYNLATEPI